MEKGKKEVLWWLAKKWDKDMWQWDVDFEICQTFYILNRTQGEKESISKPCKEAQG